MSDGQHFPGLPIVGFTPPADSRRPLAGSVPRRGPVETLDRVEPLNEVARIFPHKEGLKANLGFNQQPGSESGEYHAGPLSLMQLAGTVRRFARCPVCKGMGEMHVDGPCGVPRQS